MKASVNTGMDVDMIDHPLPIKCPNSSGYHTTFDSKVSGELKSQSLGHAPPFDHAKTQL